MPAWALNVFLSQRIVVITKQPGRPGYVCSRKLQVRVHRAYTSASVARQLRRRSLALICSWLILAQRLFHARRGLNAGPRLGKLFTHTSSYLVPLTRMRTSERITEVLLGADSADLRFF